MNQILNTKINQKDKTKKIWFKLQLCFSLLIVAIMISYTFIHFRNLLNNEQLSNSLMKNYNIYKLYAPQSEEKKSETKSSSNSFNTIFGIIEIPKIELYYPIFSCLSEELLKVSPCKFSGESLTQNDNICIAGHNYDNSLFFSKISSLNNDDEIFIFDNIGSRYIYHITNIYEVNSDDLSPIFDYDKTKKILTLVTCNNRNSNRIIVRAEQKNHD